MLFQILFQRIFLGQNACTVANAPIIATVQMIIVDGIIIVRATIIVAVVVVVVVVIITIGNIVPIVVHIHMVIIVGLRQQHHVPIVVVRHRGTQAGLVVLAIFHIVHLLIRVIVERKIGRIR